jgi:threonine/homoserine/homoserine lactone efflux protein
MPQAIGHVLPIAFAAAISSIPIMATLVILLSPARTRSAVPFLVGWAVGLAGVVTVATLAAQAIPASRSSRHTDVAVGIAETLIGLALVTLAVVRWRRQRRDPDHAMPKWLGTVGSLGPWSSFGIALLLNLRPKALLLAIAAGLAIRAPSMPVGQTAIVIVIYTVIAACTVATPIIATLAAPRRMEPRLRNAEGWLNRNSATLTSLIVLLIAVVIVGSGIARL